MGFALLRTRIFGFLKAAPRAATLACALTCALTCAALLLTSCAGSRIRVELRSDPPNAEIQNASGEIVGVTPLVLSPEQLQKLTVDGRLFAVINAPGHLPSQLITDLHAVDIYDVKLTKLDNNYFTRALLRDYKDESNELAKKLLQIQGLVTIKKLDDAEKALTEFQKTYPNIAAGYVFSGSIELMRGNPGKARGYFVRAQALDPNDPVISRILTQTKEKGAP